MRRIFCLRKASLDQCETGLHKYHQRRANHNPQQTDLLPQHRHRVWCVNKKLHAYLHVVVVGGNNRNLIFPKRLHNVSAALLFVNDHGYETQAVETFC